ncbi:MAG: YadA-like family protein, partial [Phascolarctobacterium sp.]|nr:YadA-like family protein [Phascolarctobacterium sp.]
GEPGTFTSGDDATSIYVGINRGSTGGGVGAGYAISVAVGDMAQVQGSYSVALGANSKVSDGYSVTLGTSSYVTGSCSVALGYGSVAVDNNVVSVGHSGDGLGPKTRSIINVEDVADISLKDSVGNYKYGSYAVNVNTLNAALASVQPTDLTAYAKTADVETALEGKADKATTLAGYGITDAYTKEEADSRFVKIKANDADDSKQPEISVDANGQMIFGTDSSWIDGKGEGFFAGRIDDTKDHTADNAKASMTSDGEIKGINGTFSGNVTAANLYNKTEIDDALELKANAADVYKKTETYSQGEVDTKLADKADKATTLAGYGIDDAYTKKEVDGLINGGSAAIAGLNQRLEKTNAKINKVGAGAAALAALHPLDYDPDDKLTFSAGMGNYAGENAAALGAFYRPNEKFMLSLGGTMGNGENMVNLGLSIGFYKPNGFAKMSKRELIQKVNVMEAKYEQVEAENEAMKAEIAEMKTMLQELLAKK